MTPRAATHVFAIVRTRAHRRLAHVRAVLAVCDGPSESIAGPRAGASLQALRNLQRDLDQWATALDREWARRN